MYGDKAIRQYYYFNKHSNKHQKKLSEDDSKEEGDNVI